MRKLLVLMILSLFLLAGCTQAIPEEQTQIQEETIIEETPVENIEQPIIEEVKEEPVEEVKQKENELTQEQLDEIANDKEGLINKSKLKIDLYKLPLKFNDFEFRMQFYNSKTGIKYLNYEIEPTLEDIVNSKEFFVSFGEYQGTDGGEITRTSARLFPLLRNVLGFELDTLKHITKEKDKSCKDSTLDSKVIIFNPYSEKNGVYYNEENGCIQFLTDDGKKMGGLGDKFFYTIFAE